MNDPFCDFDRIYQSYGAVYYYHGQPRPFERYSQDLWSHPMMDVALGAHLKANSSGGYSWSLEAPYNKRYTAHPVVVMAKMSGDPRFVHLPLKDLAEAVRISMMGSEDLSSWKASDAAWTDWYLRNSPGGEVTYFIRYKDRQGSWGNVGEPRKLCDERQFVHGVIRCFGLSCLLCSRVFFCKGISPYEFGLGGRPEVPLLWSGKSYGELHDCLSERYRDSSFCCEAPWLLCCADCEQEYLRWLGKNTKKFKDSLNSIDVYTIANARKRKSMGEELDAIQPGKGSRKKRNAILAKYKCDSPWDLADEARAYEAGVRKTFTVRWLIDRVSKPKERAPQNA